MKTTPVSSVRALLGVISALILTVSFSACQGDVVYPTPTDIHYQSIQDTVDVSPITPPRKELVTDPGPQIRKLSDPEN